MSVIAAISLAEKSGDHTTPLGAWFALQPASHPFSLALDTSPQMVFNEFNSLQILYLSQSESKRFIIGEEGNETSDHGKNDLSNRAFMAD
jgi:hypothetical protein